MEIRLDGMAVDGTRCSSEALHVCMDGQCQVNAGENLSKGSYTLDKPFLVLLLESCQCKIFLSSTIDAYFEYQMIFSASSQNSISFCFCCCWRFF